MALRVIGPVAVLPEATTGLTRYYYQGAILPDGLDEARVKDVLELGLIEEVDDPAEPASSEADDQDPTDPEAVPSGTAEDVLAWVGDDQSRALRALEAEKAGDNPRTTLIGKLEKLAGQQA